MVKAAAAAKAAAKLRADGVRGEAERERLAAELEGMKAKFEVPYIQHKFGHCSTLPCCFVPCTPATPAAAACSASARSSAGKIPGERLECVSG